MVKRGVMILAVLSLLAPAALRAQSEPRRVVALPAAQEPPGWGFAFAMRAGPQMEYTHPWVTEVVKGSTAEQAGLAAGDTIVAVDGRDTRVPPMFLDTTPGSRHVMRIRRAGEEAELTFVMPAAAEDRRRAPAAP